MASLKLLIASSLVYLCACREPHKNTMVIGGVPLTSAEKFSTAWRPTFEDFLSETVGRQYSPPINFVFVPVTLTSAFDMVEQGTVEFIFANPSLFSCLEAEFDVAPVATLRNREGNAETTYFGGVIFTRADNNAVNNISDLKGKIVAASSILLMGSGQVQWQEMRQHGLDLLVDPAQVIFFGPDQSKIVDAVLQGYVDVGLVRSGYIEDMVLSNRTDINLLKFINLQTSVTNRILSTKLFPEWPLAATRKVSRDLHLRVLNALATLNSSSMAAAAAKYVSWDPPLSYASVTLLNSELGIFNRISRKCIRDNDFESLVSCPPGHFKRSQEDLESRCEQLKLPCPIGSQCLCSPCQEANELELFLSADENFQVCAKMKTCGVVQQGQNISWLVVDNLHRSCSVLNLTYKLHTPIVEQGIAQPDPACSSYSFDLCTGSKGTHVLEIFANGNQIANSPFLIDVVDRDCAGEFGLDSNRVADANGSCVCRAETIEVGSVCFPIASVLAALVVPSLLVVVAACWAYLRHETNKFDSMWRIANADLKYDDPPVILGHGTFGEVFRAEYRGTLVAVKRAIPDLKGKRKRSRSMSRSGGESVTASFTESLTEGSSPAVRRNSQSGLESDNAFGNTSQAIPAEALKGVGDPAWKPKPFSRMSMRTHPYQLRQDFIAEMRMLAKLRHPCITTVMGAVLESKSEPLLVMEHMEHGSLWNLLHNASIKLDSELALPILRDVIQGMRFLHAAKPPIIHGDLKSGNVLVDSNFRAKVSDFGFSQKEKIGTFGTPYWMAPELLVGEQPTMMTDVYAFGITLWEVVTRSYPYSDDENEMSISHILAMVKAGRKRPIVPLGLRPEVESMMMDCWHQVAARRPTFEGLEKRMRALDVVGFHAAAVEAMQRQSKAMNESNKVLYEVFPKHVAEALMKGLKVEPELREMVTIYFSDIVGFTTISSVLEPRLVSDMLNRLYTKFDALAAEHGIFKVETIGDAWMGVTNLVSEQPDHAARIARFALDAVKAAQATVININDPSAGFVKIRAGFHSGPVVANVVGTRNPRYCLFGDSVNTASRMESTSKELCIHCSAQAARQVREQDANIMLQDRGRTFIKGKGAMRTYWVKGLRTSESDEPSDTVGELQQPPRLLQMKPHANWKRSEAFSQSGRDKGVAAELSSLVLRHVKTLSEGIRELVTTIEEDTESRSVSIDRVLELGKSHAELQSEFVAKIEKLDETNHPDADHDASDRAEGSAKS